MSLSQENSNYNKKAVIFGCSGLTLSEEERLFFRECQPLGFILFARNIDNPQQVQTLIEDMRAVVENPDALIMIDQEGGRVARLKPPHWVKHPPSSVFWDIAEKSPPDARDAVYLHYQLIGHELVSLGINMDCAPVLDILIPDAHDIVGDRAFGSDPEMVSILGHAACEGLLYSGVIPVIKHIPGHGRAKVDSHEELPVVDTSVDILEKTDFVPFQHLSGMDFAMTAHIIYSDIDPDAPATLSPKVNALIRDFIGFDGALMTDDLSMKALSGSMASRVEASFEAGCDIILHCNGDMEEMQEIAANVPLCSAGVRRSVAKALAAIANPKQIDITSVKAEMDRLLQQAA